MALRGQVQTGRFAGALRGRRSRLRLVGAHEQEFRAAQFARTQHRTRSWQTLELFVAPAVLFVNYRAHGGLEAPPVIGRNARVVRGADYASLATGRFRHEA